MAHRRAGDQGFRVTAYPGCNGAQHQRDNRLCAGVAHVFLQLGQMPAFDVAGLMRQHANNAICILGIAQQARIDEYTFAPGDEGVQPIIEDKMNRKRAWIQLCRF